MDALGGEWPRPWALGRSLWIKHQGRDLVSRRIKKKGETGPGRPGGTVWKRAGGRQHAAQSWGGPLGHQEKRSQRRKHSAAESTSRAPYCKPRGGKNEVESAHSEINDNSKLHERTPTSPPSDRLPLRVLSR